MRNLFFSVFFLSSQSIVFGGVNSIDSMLTVLDRTLEKKDYFIHQKQKELLGLKLQQNQCSTEQERFFLLNELIESYLSFNIDSALQYIYMQEELAHELNNNIFYTQSKLNLTSAYISTGMYYEAMAVLRSLKANLMPENFKVLYLNLFRRTFDALADFAINEELKQSYKTQVGGYRDSVFIVHDYMNLDDLTLQADALIAESEYYKAIDLLNNSMLNTARSDHQKAIFNHLLAQAWRGLEHHDNEKYYLIASSIFDIKSSVKEYISLWQLAEMLFEEGDVDRAFKYLQTSLEDATQGNMRLRTNSISNIYPIIEKAYQGKVAHQQQQQRRLLLFISLLLIALMVVTLFVLLQMRKLRWARKELKQMNSQLAHLNTDLTKSNRNLKILNSSILDSSVIKEEYIGKYMEQCLLYLDKIEEYRRWVRRNIQAESKKELLKEIDSSKFLEVELQNFYNEFDKTFLNLFPTFVEEFNVLLNPAEQTLLKSNELLNTELRIYALIRLGIGDSDKIARFLRYSLSTIYNYRTKVRNKAAGNREEFEELIMKIGLK